MAAIYLNGESFTVSDSLVQNQTVAASLEIEGRESAEYRLTEKDQDVPAGRYRIKAIDDTLVIQRATSSLPGMPYATVQDLLTIDSQRAAFGVPLDVSDIAPVVASIIDYLTPSEAAGAVEWIQGHGPTKDPDGYVVLEVGTGRMGIVPYWDYE